MFFQKKNENNQRNMSFNNRYHKRNFTLINTFNPNAASTISTIRKIEDLKRKYNKMNFQQKLNLRNTYNKIQNLKEKYNSQDNNNSNKKIKEISNYNKMTKSKNNLLIQTTDKLSFVNKTIENGSNSNLYLYTDRDKLNNYLTISDFNKLKKSNEINCQFKSKVNNKMSKLNIKMFKNYSERNNKNIREELLKFGKNIKQFLNENNLDDNNENINEEKNESIDVKNKRNKSVCPIKERINKLASVKNKIKKINQDLFKENEKNNNSNVSLDSQVDLNFKHIKPAIMKDNSIEDYFEEEQKNKHSNEILLKPVLIRSLPRPKLNIPKYPSFFYKTKS